MKLIGGKCTANNISFGSVTNGEHFLLATLDWRDFDFKMQTEICNKIGYEEYTDELAMDDFSVTLVVPRINGVLNFDYCYLHILTIGIVTLKDVAELIESHVVVELNPADELVWVELSCGERIDILNKIIEPTDLRKVD